MYVVTIRKQAQKKLASLPEKQRKPIVEAIRFLGLNPDDKRLDIKKLAGRSEYRLRIGFWRIIYERDDLLKIIAIEKFGARGDIYK
jgi:mRNA interferase RelE/StbE